MKLGNVAICRHWRLLSQVWSVPAIKHLIGTFCRYADIRKTRHKKTRHYIAIRTLSQICSNISPSAWHLSVISNCHQLISGQFKRAFP